MSSRSCSGLRPHLLGKSTFTGVALGQPGSTNLSALRKAAIRRATGEHALEVRIQVRTCGRKRVR